ncbi:MAG: hypothetical protein Q7P63_17305 [Verrucomicrobiota bacterium JB022]|nr:hypothetical protein [Verrucomicrobiota bacterium JB022]
MRDAAFPPVQKLTTGPGYHWFGYYDKLQTDPAGRFVLGMKVGFEHRSPTADDVIEVGLIDRQIGNQWVSLGESRSWGWQQGCMLQFRPGHPHEIVWNDRVGDHHATRILNLQTGAERVLDDAIYCLSPDGRFGVGTDFRRIQNMRPGYGYAGLPDPNESNRTPDDTGIYRLDLDTGQKTTLVSIRDLALIPHRGESLAGFWNYFNHLLISPDGQRLVFLHRWRRTMGERASRASGGFETRMVTMDGDGSNIYILDPSGNTSHFIWRDPEHICAWTQPEGGAERFYLFRDRTAELEPVGHRLMPRNGHNTYLPAPHADWILNDTYAHQSGRKQELYLYHPGQDRRIELGAFPAAPEYTGEWRCDLHPKATPDGRTILIDSTHEGDGRQIYAVDISQLPLGS